MSKKAVALLTIGIVSVWVFLLVKIFGLRQILIARIISILAKVKKQDKCLKLAVYHTDIYLRHSGSRFPDQEQNTLGRLLTIIMYIPEVLVLIFIAMKMEIWVNTL